MKNISIILIYRKIDRWIFLTGNEKKIETESQQLEAIVENIIPYILNRMSEWIWPFDFVPKFSWNYNEHTVSRTPRFEDTTEVWKLYQLSQLSKTLWRGTNIISFSTFKVFRSISSRKKSNVTETKTSLQTLTNVSLPCRNLNFFSSGFVIWVFRQNEK